MIYNDDYIFISIPKCGTMTMINVLTTYYNGKDEYNGQKLYRHERNIPFDKGNRLIFTVVRNPYERAISSWYYAHKREKRNHNYRETWKQYPIKFVDFLKKIRCEHRYNNLTEPQSSRVKMVDMILHLETIEDEFKCVPFYNGSPTVFPKVNSTNHGLTKDSLSEEAITLINEIYEEDFQFGYIMENT